MPVASPPRRRRPSWDSWIRPSLTYARPSAARQKSVAGPWRVRRVSRSDHSHGRRWTRRRPQSAASPCEPPRTNATRTNTRRTPHRTRPNDERTQNEQPTNTDAPARQATLSTPPTVNRPCVVRQKPVVGRSPRDRRPSIVRILSVSCPSCVRDMTFVSPCSGRQRACSHKGSRSLDEIHYAIWRIFTGGIASSSDFMGRKGLSLFRGPRSFDFFFNIKPDNCTKPYTLPIFSEYYAEHFIMSIALASNACILLSCCIPAGPVPCMLKST